MRLYTIFRAAPVSPQKCDLTGSTLHARVLHRGLLVLFFPCSKAPAEKPVQTELHSGPEHLNFLNYICTLLVKWFHSSSDKALSCRWAEIGDSLLFRIFQTLWSTAILQEKFIAINSLLWYRTSRKGCIPRIHVSYNDTKV